MTKNEVKIEIAEIPILIRCESESFIKNLYYKYKNFITQNPYELKIKVDFYKSLEVHSSKKLNLNIISTSSSQHKISFSGVEAILNLKEKKAEVIQEESIRHFDFFLKILYSLILVNFNGVLLHSAGIVRNQKGYIFFGKSESGKTTIAKFFAKQKGWERNILSDETVALRIIKRKLYAYSTPFWGEMNGKSKNIKTPVECLFHLPTRNKKNIATKTSFKKLNFLNAISVIMQNTYYSSTNLDDLNYLLDTLKSICNLVIVYRLNFSELCSLINLCSVY